MTALAILGGLILGICLAECVRAYRNAHEGHAMEAVITAAPDPREELDPNRFDWLAESWSAHRESCPSGGWTFRRCEHQWCPLGGECPVERTPGGEECIAAFETAFGGSDEDR